MEVQIIEPDYILECSRTGGTSKTQPTHNFLGEVNVGGCFLCESWLVCGDPCRQWWFGAEAQTSDFSFSTLFTQPHGLSGVFLFPAKHHNPPWAGKWGSVSQATCGDVVSLIMAEFHVRCNHCSSQGNITDSVHIIWNFFFFKNMTSLVKVITLYYS